MFFISRHNTPYFLRSFLKVLSRDFFICYVSRHNTPSFLLYFLKWCHGIVSTRLVTILRPLFVVFLNGVTGL